MTKTEDFLFPFSTCEKPYHYTEWIAQPFSVVFNFIGCIFLCYFMFYTKNWYTWTFLLSLLVFESFHTFSHSTFAQKIISPRVVHFSAYVAIFCMIMSFYIHFKKKKVHLSRFFIAYMAVLLAADLYSVIFLPFLYFFTTFMIMFASIFLYFLPYFSKRQKFESLSIVVVTLVILAMVYNEKYNCKHMLKVAPWFPFHIFVEITGALAFFLIGRFFYKL